MTLHHVFASVPMQCQGFELWLPRADGRVPGMDHSAPPDNYKVVRKCLCTGFKSVEPGTSVG